MKKITLFLLIFIFALSSAALFSCGSEKTSGTPESTSGAEIAPLPQTGAQKLSGEISFDKQKVRPGDEITLTLSINSNPGFNVMLVSFKLPSGVFVSSDGDFYKESGLTVSFDRTIIVDAGYSDSTYTGKVFYITYKLSSSAPAGKYTVSVTPDATNFSEQEIEASFASAQFEVEAPEEAKSAETTPEKEIHETLFPETSDDEPILNAGSLEGSVFFDKEKVSPGDKITLTLNIKTNPGFNVLIVSFRLPSGVFISSEGDKNRECGLDVTFGKNIVVDSGYGDTTYTGDLFSVTYTVDSSAPAGRYTVSAIPDASNYAEKELEASFTEAVFEVTDDKDDAALTGEDADTEAAEAEAADTKENGETSPEETDKTEETESSDETLSPEELEQLFEESKSHTFSFIWDNGLINYYFGVYNSSDNTLNTGSAGWIALALLLIPGYLLGSINCAIVISKKYFKEDIRTKGSGNAGMTNVLRTYGKKYAVMTLAGDMMKTVVAVLIGRIVLGTPGAFAAGLGAVIGHMWPVFYNFKGGKGVAAAFAMILMTNPLVGLILFLAFVAVVAFSKYLSLGSIMGAMLYPVAMRASNNFSAEGYFVKAFKIFVAMTVAILIVVKHRENIKRLYAGQENKFSLKKKKDTPEDKKEEE